MGSRRWASSQKSVVPGIVRTKADAPMKTSRQRRRTGGASLKNTSYARISCAKAKQSTMETATPIQRTIVTGLTPLLGLPSPSRESASYDLEEFDGTKTIIEKSSSQCYLDESPNELSSKASELCPPCHAVGKGFSKTPTLECGQTSQTLTKLKLQLFPIDEVTRKGLEKDGHNPHLELTLGARKKISSVLKHLNIKWGNSSIALGELMLFPYNMQQGNLANYRRWTLKETDISAADVYATMGCPPIFRLRYGWFSSLEPMTSHVPDLTSLSYEDCLKPEDDQKGCINMKEMDLQKQPCQEDMPVSVSASSNATIAKPTTLDQANIEVNSKMGSNTTFFSSLWADSIINISMGDLLKETSRNSGANRCDPLPVNKDSCHSQMPFSSESFDTAIAAYITRHQGTGLSTPASHTSIWDAEETCHAFPFQKIENSRNKVVVPSQDNASGPSSVIAGLNSKRSPDSDHACQESTPDSLPCDQRLDNTETSFKMSDIIWPDSLGPLDLGLPSSRQIISGDSISLSGLISSSLDAFQNCSFFR